MARILIVDDDELIAELASEILIDAGYACGWMTDAQETWDLLQTGKRPDILLLDQDMPGMSGVSLLRKLRGSEKFYDLPVMMFTAVDGQEDETQAIYAGAQGYIRKPFDTKSLTYRVERLLAKRGNRARHRDIKKLLAENHGLTQRPEPLDRRIL